jgi:hypothetical protein
MYLSLVLLSVVNAMDPSPQPAAMLQVGHCVETHQRFTYSRQCCLSIPYLPLISNTSGPHQIAKH